MIYLAGRLDDIRWLFAIASCFYLLLIFCDMARGGGKKVLRVLLLLAFTWALLPTSRQMMGYL